MRSPLTFGVVEVGMEPQVTRFVKTPTDAARARPRRQYMRFPAWARRCSLVAETWQAEEDGRGAVIGQTEEARLHPDSGPLGVFGGNG